MRKISHKPWFGRTNAGIQRGFPTPESRPEMRDPPWIHLVPFGTTSYSPAPPYDFGAAGFASRQGIVFSNPIGAGIVVSRDRLYPLPMATAAYVDGQIFWNSQVQNQGRQPINAGILPPGVLAQLLGFPADAAAVPANMIPGLPVPTPPTPTV